MNETMFPMSVLCQTLGAQEGQEGSTRDCLHNPVPHDLAHLHPSCEVPQMEHAAALT